jgi:hypothetical protein
MLTTRFQNDEDKICGVTASVLHGTVLHYAQAEHNVLCKVQMYVYIAGIRAAPILT